MSWDDAPPPSGICPRCTGVGAAHYLTCPTLNCPLPVRSYEDVTR